MRFYEGGYSGTPYGQRGYNTIFSQSTSRYIYWELTLAFPKPNRKTNFNIVSKYYDSYGNFLTRLTQQCHIDSGWTYSYHNYGYGWNNPGNWRTGTYRVEIFVDNQRITSGTFSITSGRAPFGKDANVTEKTTDYLKKGIEYGKKKKWDEAITEFNKVIDLDPLNTNAYFNRGLAYLERYKNDKAILDFSQVIKLDPENSVAYYNRGLAYLRLEEYDNAITDCNMTIKLKPEDSQAYLNRGNAYKKTDHYDKAIADYTQAIKIDPNDTAAYSNRADVYSQKGNFEKAIKDYSQLISLDPKLANNYIIRGDIYLKSGEYNEAIEDYTQAITFFPDLAMFYLSRGKAYFVSGRFDEAIKDYTEALKLDPKVGGVYSTRAHAYYKKGDYTRARKDVQKAEESGVKVDSKFLKKLSKAQKAEESYDRALEYSKKGQYKKAISECTQAIKLNPENAGDYYYIRGITYSQRGQNKKAIADLSEAVKLKPEGASKYYEMRALIYREDNRFDEAIADYTHAIKLKPQYAYMNYVYRGECYSEIKQFDRAIADFGEAIKLNPKKTSAYNRRAQAFYHKGDYENAWVDSYKTRESIVNPADNIFIRRLRKAMRKDKTDSGKTDTHFVMGVGHSKQKKWDTAIAEFSKVIEYSPGDVDGYYNRGNAYQKKKQYVNALSDFNQAIKLDPDDIHLYLIRGDILNKMGRFAEAIEDYTHVIMHIPGHRNAFYKRGTAYNTRGDYTNALKDVEKAKELGKYVEKKFYEKLRKAAGTVEINTERTDTSLPKNEAQTTFDKLRKDSDKTMIKNDKSFTVTFPFKNQKDNSTEQSELKTDKLLNETTQAEGEFIPSINAKVTALRFYESGSMWDTKQKRQYNTHFPRSVTRIINWELSLTFPSPERKTYFSITAEYYSPQGNIIMRQTKENYITSGWTASSYFHGYGWSQPGRWEPGTYRVDIFVDRQKVSSGPFTITSDR